MLNCWFLSTLLVGLTITSSFAQRKETPQSRLKIIPRGKWLAGATAPDTAVHKRHTSGPRRITVHHPELRTLDTLSEDQEFKLVRRFHEEHVKEGWGEVAYHFFISPTGRIIQGRDPQYWADSRTDYGKLSDKGKDGHICISLIGDFRSLQERKTDINYDVRAEARKANEQALDHQKVLPWDEARIKQTIAQKTAAAKRVADQEPTSAAGNSLRALIAYLQKQYDIPKAALYTHREVADSNCPGQRAQDLVDKIR